MKLTFKVTNKKKQPYFEHKKLGVLGRMGTLVVMTAQAMPNQPTQDPAQGVEMAHIELRFHEDVSAAGFELETLHDIELV
jgi:hypothetical protein